MSDLRKSNSSFINRTIALILAFVVMFFCFYLYNAQYLYGASSDDNGDVIVYITNTGSKYHRENCSYLKSKNAISLREAVEQGYTPCSRCNPPRLGERTEEDDDPYEVPANNTNSGSSAGSRNPSQNHAHSNNVNYSVSNSAKKKNEYPIGISCAAFVGGAGILAIISKSKRAKADKRRKEKLAADRKIFLDKLNGERIRDKAGVPANYYFYNGLPKDNNNREYGSFTLYISKSGNHYHSRRGCCSARIPIHSFKASRLYKPCSKCCKSGYRIPDWYMNYSSLISEAQWLGFNGDNYIFNTDRLPDPLLDVVEKN